MAAKNVSFTKPKTPSFIEKFKEKVGYQETATVETKLKGLDSSTLDDREVGDEKPIIILGSNVSEAEADEFLARMKEKEEDSKEDTDKDRNLEQGGKIMFKKPTKRKSGENEKELKSTSRKKSKTASTMKGVKNKSLLSFEDEGEDD